MLSKPDFDNLQAHAFEGLIAFAAILSSLVFFSPAVDLQRTSVGQTLHPWDFAWNSLFLLGGILVFIGLAYPARVFFKRLFGEGLETGGLIMLATAILINLIASIIVIGVAPGQGTTLAVFVACVLRARTINSKSVRFKPVRIGGGRH